MSSTRSKKSAAAIAVSAVVANGGEGGGGVGGSVGRLQLKGVLDGLVKRSINDDKSPDGVIVDGDVEEGARDLLELNSSEVINGATLVLAGGDVGGVAVGGVSVNSRKRPATGKVRRRGRKRRRKDCLFMSDSSDDDSKERHTPHVMTLFDRKVDLARFTSTTPIYTMCRDWMSNNPDKLSHHYSNNNRHTPSPLVGSTSLNHTGDGILTTPLNGSTNLPAPIPLPTDAEGRAIRLDIPKPLPPHINKTDEFDKALENSQGDMSKYKADHLKRWREIRGHWKKASILNQARYVESLRLIKDMFQR